MVERVNIEWCETPCLCLKKCIPYTNANRVDCLDKTHLG